VKALALVAIACSTASAGPLPKGFAVIKASISPDGKLGVIGPDVDHAREQADSRQNQLVVLATGKVLATIDAPTTFEHENHADFAPQWSTDGSLLEWYVDGKWGSFALVLVRVEHGAVTAQLDVRDLAVREVLAEVQRTHPLAAAAAKREGATDGWWFRDGLAIEVKPTGTVVHDEGIVAPRPALPLTIEVTYTSNPKELDEYPKAAQLSGTLSLVVDAKLQLARK
jgi:hypothetical protein